MSRAPCRTIAGLVAVAAIAATAVSRPSIAQRGDRPTADSASRATRLRGVITSRGDDSPVKGVDVWAVSLDRHAQSDSAGAFRFDGLPAGQLLFEFRRVGFDVRRDTITLEAGKELFRRVSLASNAQRLDTVRTVAGEQQYLSPALRGFEQRRLSGNGGRFISDSVLRANDSKTLADVLRGRMAGATVTTGFRGARVLASTRKQCFGPVVTECSGNMCYVEIHVDGVLVYYPNMTEHRVKDPTFQPPDLSRMAVTEFAGVEFYADAASMPIEMHTSSDEGCGSLWLWTREK
jgi:Carboxypeptidase regulatory-like domain